jgi:hypothetical protein
MLDAVFKGLLFIENVKSSIDFLLAAKFSNEANEQHRSAAELRLALVSLFFIFKN